MREVINELERLRRHSAVLLLLQRMSVIVAWAVGTAVALVLLDYVLRLPGEFRLALLIASLAALLVGLRRYLADALRYRPTLTQLALRVEESMPALRGRLASCVEFVLAGVDERNPLAARSVRETQRRLAGESMRAIIRPGRTLRRMGTMMVVCAVATALTAAYPAAARTGLARLLAPYGSAQWPARTAVISLMHEVIEHEGVYPRGRALPLRARNLTAGAEDGRVDAHYRLQRDGGFGLWEHILLTHQGSGVHERLVDTGAEVIEFYFATEDARTQRERLALVAPPAVVRATLAVEPPAYAAGRVAPREMDLGPGIDDRAVTEHASLVGSRIDLLLELNKPLAAPESDAERAPWIRQTFGWYDDPLPRLHENPENAGQWRLSWRIRETRDLLVALEDEHGLSNEEPIRYRILALTDQPPSAIVIEPQRDEAVLPTAKVGIVGEARDDVALSRLGLNAHLQRGEAEVVQPLLFAPHREAAGVEARIEAELDLADFDLVEGDTILLAAIAEDACELDGVRHDPVISTTRRLHIIGDSDFAARLRRELAAVRQNAVRIEARQAELQDGVMGSGVRPGLRQAQARLGDRLIGQREVIRALEERAGRNRFQDEPLAALLRQSRDLLDYAGRAGNRALEAIEAAAGSGPADHDGIIEAQQEVRDELVDLIRLLDRDEDTWLVERELEALIQQQADAEAETAELSRETIGRDREELPEAQVREIDRIAQRQREMGDRARRLIGEMRRRAEVLDEIDSSSAAALRAAAETGERREVDRDMERAAEQVETNRLQNAAGSQQAARRTLGRMMADLHQARRARVEQLLRKLADLVESIGQLIAAQENELIALARAEQASEFSGRDRAMIRLARNTRAVALEARAAASGAQSIGRALDRAADAQDAAVTALRARPVDVFVVREAEERSLDLLKEAKQLAEGLQRKAREERAARRREALIESYRLLARKQVAARQEALPLAEIEPLGRRQLVEARRLGNVQNEIRIGLDELERNTSEIVESEIFSYVHQLMDEWCGEVSEALWEGDVGVFITDRQAMIAESILRQIEALQPEEPDEFARESGGGSGGGGAGSGAPPLIPPVAEIKRLRSLQEQIYNQTKALDSRTDLDDGRRRHRLLETGRMQRKLIELGREMLQRLPQPPAEEGSQEEPMEQ